VLCYDGTSGAFIRVAATGGGLSQPDGLGFDAAGNLIVSDFAPSSIVKKYNPLTGAFLGPLVSDPGLVQPLEHRFSSDGTALFVSSFTNSQVRKYDASTGAFLGVFASAPLNGPVGQLVLPDGSLLVSSWNNSAIYRFNAETGALLGTFTAGGALDHPNNMTIVPIPEPSMGVVAGAVIILLHRKRWCCKPLSSARLLRARRRESA
jgi:WD40 repeat protein